MTTRMATVEGHHIFTTELTRFAQRAGDSRITTLIDGLGGPLRVSVRGRHGVGRRTVAAALGAADLVVTDTAPDVAVIVVAEALKPEDLAMLSDTPALVVLNKADLAGFGAGGPISVADRRAAEMQSSTGVPTVAVVGLLATVALDDELVAAMRVLTTEPADLASTDGFLAAEHSVPRRVRARLLDTLDLFGIAHGVLALGHGADAQTLPAAMRQLSKVDRMLARLTGVGAEARYQQMQSALESLRVLAARGVPGVAEFLACDGAVLAAMAAAVDVVEAAGLTVDDTDDPPAHLQRALHWDRYSRGPVNRLHRRCGADISRGSLRLMGRAEGR